MTGFDLRLRRVVNTTPEAAFRHWVDPEARRRWAAPDAAWIVEAETDLRVGGGWRVRFGPTRDWMVVEHGEFEEIDPPHRVVYASRHECPDGRPEFATRVSVSFDAHVGGTLLTVLDAGYPSAQLRDANKGGWPAFPNAFERTVAPSLAG
jgi:uncharacterized protein YndB with AHSA1/START domain